MVRSAPPGGVLCPHVDKKTRLRLLELTKSILSEPAPAGLAPKCPETLKNTLTSQNAVFLERQRAAPPPPISNKARYKICVLQCLSPWSHKNVVFPGVLGNLALKGSLVECMGRLCHQKRRVWTPLGRDVFQRQHRVGRLGPLKK